MIETYLSTEFQLDTRPRVSAKLNVIEVTENEIELKVVLSEFDPKKKRYDIHVEVDCQNEKNDIIYSKNSNSFESLHFVFDNLDPNTINLFYTALFVHNKFFTSKKMSIETCKLLYLGVF